MAKKRRRRKSKLRITTKNLKPVESKEEQLKKFPKKLVKAFLNLDKTAVLVKEYGIKFYDWTEKAYDLYTEEAIKYLGKNKAKDPIESGKLIVLLSRATMDVCNGKKTKKKKEK
jgi:hypothetical protein